MSGCVRRRWPTAPGRARPGRRRPRARPRRRPTGRSARRVCNPSERCAPRWPPSTIWSGRCRPCGGGWRVGDPAKWGSRCLQHPSHSPCADAVLLEWRNSSREGLEGGQALWTEADLASVTVGVHVRMSASIGTAVAIEKKGGVACLDVYRHILAPGPGPGRRTATHLPTPGSARSPPRSTREGRYRRKWRLVRLMWMAFGLMGFSHKVRLRRTRRVDACHRRQPEAGG